jgi:hypothetical protein
MILVTVALAVCVARAWAEDAYTSQPLAQAQFDKLIPTSSPTATTTFNRLRQTTWPLINPGVANVPITENLIHPVDYPLLITTGDFGHLPRIKPMHGFVQMPQRKSESQVPQTGQHLG